MVIELRQEIASLREELGRNSTNSSQPPSTDPPDVRERRREKKPKAKRKRGGQRGHKGHHRALVPVEEVDEVVDRYPEACRCCGHELPKLDDPSPERHQVVDLPAVKGHTTEYRLHGVSCPHCRAQTRGELPAGVSWSGFGPHLVAFNGLLTGAYRLSKRLAARLFADAFGIRVSLGSVSKNEERLSQALEQPVDEALEHVQQQAVKYCDATTWRQGGARLQLWTVASALITVFLITADGTRETVKQLLGKVKGVLVSDRAAVFRFWTMKKRQVCWAHLIRAFTAFTQRDGQSTEIGTGLLLQAQRLFKWWHRVRDGDWSRATFQAHLPELKTRVRGLLEEGERCDQKKTRGTCANLLKHFEAMWTFAYVEGVDPTNNHAERELRPVVILRKTSFGTQSDRGSRFVERITTVVASLRKQGRNVLEYLVAAQTAALNNESPPSLLPPDGVTT